LPAFEMTANLDRPTREAVFSLLAAAKLLADSAPRLAVLAGDGSDRRFLRISQAQGPTLIAVLPSGNPAGRAEARAAYLIGRHLQARGVPVPQIYGFAEASGIMLCEDLGDVLLHDKLAAGASAPARGRAAVVENLYREAIDVLLHLQIVGRQGFDPAWCWETGRYDRQVMIDKEANYFLTAFCRDYLGKTALAPGLGEEFEALATRAARLPADFFLHRDFQSRNLMIHEGRLRVIDFQGGRLGPLGYDLAALLLDPYAALDEPCRAGLLDYYLARLSTPPYGTAAFDQQAFRRGFYYLALQRNLQILGAYAFLTQKRHKPFFQQYLQPAAMSLAELLTRPAGEDYPCLRKLAAEIAAAMDKNQ